MSHICAAMGEIQLLQVALGVNANKDRPKIVVGELGRQARLDVDKIQHLPSPLVILLKLETMPPHLRVVTTGDQAKFAPQPL